MIIKHSRFRPLIPAVALALAAASSGCRDADAEKAVYALLHCDECRAHELDSVRVLGDRAVPMLQRTLAEPTTAQWDRVAHDVTGAWRRMSRELARTPNAGTLADSSTVVKRHTRDYFASMQDRAVIALNAIHTPAARGVLAGVVARDTVGVHGTARAVVRHAKAALATF